MKQLIRFQYEDAAGAGGGLPPSLSDLDGIAPPTPPAPPAAPPVVPIVSGDGSQSPEDLAKAAAEKEAADKEAAEKAAAEQAAADQAAADAGEGGAPDDGDDFWDKVNTLRGAPLEVVFPDDVDPLSPEGVIIRDKAVADEAVEKFSDWLAKTDPRGYAYMLHRQAGGNDEDFFSTKSFSLPEYETFKENVDIQSRVYSAALSSKGLDADVVKMAVDKAIKDGKLFDLADNAYKSAEKEHQDALKKIEDATAQQEAAYHKSVGAITQRLTTTVKEGTGLKIVIPETDKQPFQKFLQDQMEYVSSEKKFVFSMEIGDDLARQVEALYFLYKKGDLKSLITRAATTKSAQRLGAIVDKSKKDKVPSEPPPAAKPAFVALGDL